MFVRVVRQEDFSLAVFALQEQQALRQHAQ